MIEPPDMAQWLKHGGRLDLARAAFAGAPEPWLDLSTGINPLAYPAGTMAAECFAGLPAPSALRALEEAAARSFLAPKVPIVALPGSETGLRLLQALDLPPPFRHVSPGYGTYAAVDRGARSITPENARGAADEGGTVLLGNPNNPDGRLIAPQPLIEIARRLGRRGGMLIVDEAFADALPGSSVLPLIDEDAPVIVFRSFGKFFGLAGLRLGFLAGNRVMVERMRALLGDWPVSTAAITIGQRAYRDTAWIAAARADITRRAAALDAVLARHGLAGRGDCPLFRLIETADAHALFMRLAEWGILTRPFAARRDWLRFGVPADAAALARLDRALADG